MPYDTFLHRSFDYQLQPFSTTIIDREPFRSLTRYVLSSSSSSSVVYADTTTQQLHTNDDYVSRPPALSRRDVDRGAADEASRDHDYHYGYNHNHNRSSSASAPHTSSPHVHSTRLATAGPMSQQDVTSTASASSTTLATPPAPLSALRNAGEADMTHSQPPRIHRATMVQRELRGGNTTSMMLPRPHKSRNSNSGSMSHGSSRSRSHSGSSSSTSMCHDPRYKDRYVAASGRTALERCANETDDMGAEEKTGGTRRGHTQPPSRTHTPGHDVRESDTAARPHPGKPVYLHLPLLPSHVHASVVDGGSTSDDRHNGVIASHDVNGRDVHMHTSNSSSSSSNSNHNCPPCEVVDKHSRSTGVSHISSSHGSSPPENNNEEEEEEARLHDTDTEFHSAWVRPMPCPTEAASPSHIVVDTSSTTTHTQEDNLLLLHRLTRKARRWWAYWLPCSASHRTNPHDKARVTDMHDDNGCANEAATLLPQKCGSSTWLPYSSLNAVDVILHSYGHSVVYRRHSFSLRAALYTALAWNEEHHPLQHCKHNHSARGQQQQQQQQPSLSNSLRECDMCIRRTRAVRTSEVVQLEWFWGKLDWSGVLNLRLLPPLLHDDARTAAAAAAHDDVEEKDGEEMNRTRAAIRTVTTPSWSYRAGRWWARVRVPVCDYVMHTPWTEWSLQRDEHVTRWTGFLTLYQSRPIATAAADSSIALAEEGLVDAEEGTLVSADAPAMQEWHTRDAEENVLNKEREGGDAVYADVVGDETVRRDEEHMPMEKNKSHGMHSDLVFPNTSRNTTVYDADQAGHVQEEIFLYPAQIYSAASRQISPW